MPVKPKEGKHDNGGSESQLHTPFSLEGEMELLADCSSTNGVRGWHCWGRSKEQGDRGETILNTPQSSCLSATAPR